MLSLIIIDIQWYITMKKSLSLLALSAVASSAFAQDDNWYFGLNVLNTNAEQTNSFRLEQYTDAHLKYSDMSRETGFGINFGKQFTLKNQFSVGFEAEYISFGSFSGKRYIYVSTVSVAEESFELDAAAVNLNIKPKYYFADTDFYLGAIVGVGIYNVDIDIPGLGSDDGSEWGFNYGIEAGYEITPELTVSAGYRSFMTAIDVEGAKEDFELELDSFYAGLAYKF